MVAGLNFCVDFLLLAAVNALTGYPMAAGRCALGAALGAAYAAGCFVPGFTFLGALHWRIISLGLMSAAAFGVKSAKRCGLFVVLSFALGGCAMLLGRESFFAPVGAAAGLWAVCRIFFSRVVGARRLVEVSISDGKMPVRLLALKDTGNDLRDPMTGLSILVVDAAAGERLTGLSPGQLADPTRTLTEHPGMGLRLVPYQAVGSRSLLLAKRFGAVQVGNSVGARLVAFAPEGFSGTEYRALTGGNG